MTVRVWLIGFVLLFTGVELLEWLFELGSSQVGYWTMIGGLGLAAASNAKHLPKLSSRELSSRPENEEIAEPVEPAVASQQQAEPKKTEAIAPKKVDRDDSISFRVRLPWR